MVFSFYKKLSFVIILCCSIFLISGSLHSLPAGDVATTIKQLNKTLRTAEKDMFGGKTDKSIAALENIKALLVQLKQEDPNNAKLKQAEKKHQRLVKDLERRTGKNLGGGSLSTATTNTSTALPKVPQTQPDSSKDSVNLGVIDKKPAVPSRNNVKLPHQARRSFDKASRGLKNIGKFFTQLDDPGFRGNKAQLISRLENSIETIQKQLNDAKELAAEKNVSSHPSFDEANADLKVLKEKTRATKGKFSKQQALAKGQAQKIEADVQKLKEEYDRLNPILGAATGTVIYYNDLAPAKKLLTQLKEFEANNRESLSRLITLFGDQYGTSREDIDKKASEMGYVGEYYSASFHYLELSTGIDKISKTGIVMAEDLARKAEELINRSGKTHDFSLLEQYEKAHDYLDLARQFDNNNSVVKNLASSIDQKITAGMGTFGEKIDKQTWPQKASNAPGNAKKLTKIAKKWFKSSPDWGSRSQNPYEIMAVVVTGPWSIQKKNILEEPIMYGLPVAVAVQKDSDKKENIARVFSLTLRTKEMRGVKMEPPFDHATVGESYYIRPGTL